MGHDRQLPEHRRSQRRREQLCHWTGGHRSGRRWHVGPTVPRVCKALVAVGHFETVCWSDPSQTSGGAVSCSGAPSTWSGFGGTSVATPTMAAIQALVNQKTGQTWGTPNPYYY